MPPPPETPSVIGVDLGVGGSVTVVTLIFNTTREAVEAHEILQQDPNIRAIEGQESAEVPDQFRMNVTYIPGQQQPARDDAFHIVAEHLSPTPWSPLRPAPRPEPEHFVPTFPAARRVTVPLFEIAANPRVNLAEIQARRFDIIDRGTLDELIRVTVKKLPRVLSRFDRLEHVLALPA